MSVKLFDQPVCMPRARCNEEALNTDNRHAWLKGTFFTGHDSFHRTMEVLRKNPIESMIDNIVRAQKSFKNHLKSKT